MQLKKLTRWSCVISAIAVTVFVSGTAMASSDCPSCGASQASMLLPEASGLVLVGTLSIAGASGMLIVDSIESVADGVILVFKGASQAANCSVKLGAEAIRGSAVMVGSAVNVVAMSTGTMLVASGKALAFVPNELGTSLLHQSRVR